MVIISYEKIKLAGIPAARIYFPEEDRGKILEEIGKALQSGRLTQGDTCRQFENEFGAYVGTKYAITVNSGTSAIEIPMRIFGVESKNVIVPPNTFFATPAAVIHAGGRVKYADVENETFSLDPESLKENIDKKTAGVIVVHIGGIITPKMKEIKEICQDHKLFLFEDCAHAHGSSLNGQKAGTFGDAASFSFFPTKVMTSGEGGMIVTNDENMDKRARIFRNQGMSWEVGNINVEMGYNWRMSELHAILGLYQLRRLESFIEGRTRVARIYDRMLKHVESIKPLTLPSNLRSSYYKYIVLLDKRINRDELKKKLKEKYNIALSGEVYDSPCHLQPVLQGKYKKSDFPVAVDICARHICLPVYPTMRDEEAEYVAQALKEAIEELNQ